MRGISASEYAVPSPRSASKYLAPSTRRDRIPLSVIPVIQMARRSSAMALAGLTCGSTYRVTGLSVGVLLKGEGGGFWVGMAARPPRLNIEMTDSLPTK